MSDRAKVYVTDRVNAAGKTIYSVRWWSPEANRWRSKTIGTNEKRANHEAALIEKGIEAGTHCDLRSITWAAFTKEHLARLASDANRTQSRIVLEELGAETGGIEPKRITFGMVESYLHSCKARGNAASTVGKKAKILKAAFNAAIRRGYLARNPAVGLRLERANRPVVRVATAVEEAAILNAAQDLYGEPWKIFLTTALATGGRRGELLSLLWANVDLDGQAVVFVETKGRRDRRIPISASLASDLRRLQAQTLKDGGPFVAMSVDTVKRRWRRTLAKAKVKKMRLHDLRKTFCTRLLVTGTPITVVQKMAGHANIATTAAFYSDVCDADMVAAVQRLEAVRVG
ncbi:MAG: tyrosine-type recombinase/integrase [Phycisphaerae bacterium]|nr:tyrosine-type recombinase/integrase [Phycisphaerae bacterium]